VIVVPGLDDIRILPVMNGGPDMARTSDGELERVDVEALLVGVGLESRFLKNLFSSLIMLRVNKLACLFLVR
jgi:hypothetical protein